MGNVTDTLMYFVFFFDQVRATDRDTLRNRKLSYSIVNDVGNAFAIGKRGLVTVNNPAVIDRKKNPKYTLVIEAKDDGEPRLSSTTTLKIIVLSHTDTPPQFNKLGYTFNITENNEKNIALGQIIVRSTKNLVDKKIVVTVINDASNDFFVDGNNYLKVPFFLYFLSFVVGLRWSRTFLDYTVLYV